MSMTRLVPAHDEWMDACDDDADLERAFVDLERVHRWFLGKADVCRAVGALLPHQGVATVLDVGCGGGDLGRAIVRWAARRGRLVQLTGVDRNAHAVRIAHGRTREPQRGPSPPRAAGTGTPRFATADAARLPFRDRSFDIVLMSLTLHHFSGDERTTVVAELSRVARRGIVVNDLLRSRLNLAGARLLAATAWRRSRLTRHDGPISVLRAFTPDELKRALAVPLLRPARIRRRYLHRLVATALRIDFDAESAQ
ncbi:MAG: methyltransferase domain-containing protein [Gemmatimonadetes bacterium]|nr:methyltransferase domain-containing protein [Gemmatimonadota bacterium]